MKRPVLEFFQNFHRTFSWMCMVTLLQGLINTVGKAETTNKRMILPGTRAQALAGAYTAIADDASAGWYNPAGLAFIHAPNASLTANNYSRSKRNISGATTDSILAENSASLYPGFAGSAATLGPAVIGWSYFTLEKQNTDESQILDVQSDTSVEPFRYYRSNLTTGNLIHIGASISLPLGPHLAVGVSEFYYRREKQTALKERSLFSSGLFYDSFLRQSTTNEGTQTVPGLMLRIDSFSLGLSAKIPRALTDKTEIETTSVIYTGPSPELGSEASSSHREDELIVRTWSLGVAWKPAPWFILSTDAVYYPATASPWLQSGGFDTKAVLDGSVGADVRFDALLLGGGAFTNSSLVRTPTASLTTVAPARIDYVGYTASLGLAGKQSETRIILVRQQGKGKAQVVQSSLSMHNVSDTLETVCLSSSFQF
jgi:hypothetical protein